VDEVKVQQELKEEEEEYVWVEMIEEEVMEEEVQQE
jgi:hypothetical protein